MPESASASTGSNHRVTRRKITPEESAAWRRRSTEVGRNADYWNEHHLDLSKRYPNKWVLIYDGGTVRVFDGLQDMWDAKEALPAWQRETAFDHFVRTKARVG